MESKLKSGDLVYCKPGHETGKDGDGHYGGAGYWSKRVFTIGQIVAGVIWPLENSAVHTLNHPESAPRPKEIDARRRACGVHIHAVELYQENGLAKALTTIKEEIYGV